jgi:hypothetical protein
MLFWDLHILPFCVAVMWIVRDGLIYDKKQVDSVRGFLLEKQPVALRESSSCVCRSLGIPLPVGSSEGWCKDKKIPQDDATRKLNLLKFL